MKLRRFPPWIAVVLGAVSVGLAGLAVGLRSKGPFPLSPLTATLGGAALGVIAVQLLWIRDLLRPTEPEPGSMVLSPKIPDNVPPPKQWVAGAIAVLGLVILGVNHALAVDFHRVYFLLTMVGPFCSTYGLLGLFDPRLLASPKGASSRNPKPEAEAVLYLFENPAWLFSFLAGGCIGFSIWNFLY
jgi:hypothetical protein